VAATTLRPDLLDSVDNLRGLALRRLAEVRLATAAAFLLISAWLGLAHGIDHWRVYVVPLAFYALVALMLRLVSRRDLNSLAVPFIDVPVVFVLQFVSMPLSPFPAGVAGWSLGLFVFLSVLSALALEVPVVIATLAMSCLAEGLLQRAAGVGWGAVAASAVVLTMASAVTVSSGRRLLALVSQLVSSEVARRVAEQHNEELEQANATIAHINEELREAQRNAETLTNLLVHDMKGPLTGVLGAFDLVEMRMEDAEEVPEVAVDLAAGRRSAQRLLDMIGDLLGIARLEQGEFRPARADTDIAGLIADVIGDHARSAASRGIELRTLVAADLRASIDPHLVRRALDNLVSNAISFAARGQRVEVAAQRSDGSALLCVRNDGPVIPLEARERLFGKHAMLGARRGHNAGLGLYLCRLVASAHGGNIELVDEPGWSVSFEMKLPDA